MHQHRSDAACAEARHSNSVLISVFSQFDATAVVSRTDGGRRRNILRFAETIDLSKTLSFKRNECYVVSRRR